MRKDRVARLVDVDVEDDDVVDEQQRHENRLRCVPHQYIIVFNDYAYSGSFTIGTSTWCHRTETESLSSIDNEIIRSWCIDFILFVNIGCDWIGAFILFWNSLETPGIWRWVSVCVIVAKQWYRLTYFQHFYLTQCTSIQLIFASCSSITATEVIIITYRVCFCCWILFYENVFLQEWCNDNYR